jgi:peptidoglycan hydrolase-like protein with peptidoglycan-binding domain
MNNNIMKKIIIAGLMLLASALVLPAVSLAAEESVTCRPEYRTDLVGKTVTWTASISHASSTATYTYAWSGDEGLSGDTDTATISYTSAGTSTKNASVVVNNGVEDITANCTAVEIYTPETVPALSASCSPSTDIATLEQSINWTSNISGGLYPYTVDWSGDELSETTSGTDPVTSDFIYSTAGTKTANMVKVSSRYGDETASLSNIACDFEMEVVDGDEPEPLVNNGTSCSASGEYANINSSFNWNVNLNVLNGRAPYTVVWTGTDSLTGETSFSTTTGSDSFSFIYSTTGFKTASIYRIYDDAGTTLNVNIPCGSVTARTTGGGGGNTEELISCTYTYGDTWSACVNGEQTRTVSPNPTGCLNQPIEPIVRACTIGGNDNGTSTATSTNNGTGTSTDDGTNNGNNNNSNDNGNNGNNNNQNDGTNGNQPGTTTVPGFTGDQGSSNNPVDNTSGYNVDNGYQFNNNQNPNSGSGDDGDQNQGLTPEEIANLQNRLFQEGFYDGPINGVLTPETIDALKRYQEANGLPVTGVLDEATRQFMNENGGETVNGYYINPNYIFNHNQEEGDRGQDVANLQNRLTNEGFYFGPITGFFGAFTKDALKEYQKANGLPVTGKLDEATRAKLNAETREALASIVSELLKKAEADNSNGLLAAAAGLIKDNGRNVIYIILGLALLGLISWGVVAGFRKNKDIA